MTGDGSRVSPGVLRPSLSRNDWWFPGCLSSSQRLGCIRINPLQQENPRGVRQWIGGRLEIHATMTEVPCENRHNPIQGQIVGAGFSFSNTRLPKNGEANRLSWVSCANFSVLQNFPVAVSLWLNLRRRRHSG